MDTFENEISNVSKCLLFKPLSVPEVISAAGKARWLKGNIRSTLGLFERDVSGIPVTKYGLNIGPVLRRWTDAKT